MPRKRICILVFSEIARDGRVLREIECARKSYEIEVVAFGAWDPPENVQYFPLAKPAPSSFRTDVLRLFWLAVGKFNSVVFERLFWQQAECRHALEILNRRQYDLIHANDWMALPVAACAAQNRETRVLFDAHEYTPAQFNQYLTGRYLKSRYYEYLLRIYSKRVNGMVTVSEGIAKLYRENFGWETTVIRNAPEYVPVEFHPTSPVAIQLVHHGSAIPERHLEDLIHLTSLLDDRFNLTLILVPTQAGYLAHLKDLAARSVPKRVRFMDPVHPRSLASCLAAYDIGVHLLMAVNLNHLYALPNKLFEFIMAGLGVAVFSLPEMARIVEEYRIGVTPADQSIRSMAYALNLLSVNQIDEFKKNSLLLAKTLNADVEMQKLIDLYARLLDQ